MADKIQFLRRELLADTLIFNTEILVKRLHFCARTRALLTNIIEWFTNATDSTVIAELPASKQ